MQRLLVYIYIQDEYLKLIHGVEIVAAHASNNVNLQFSMTYSLGLGFEYLKINANQKR